MMNVNNNRRISVFWLPGVLALLMVLPGCGRGPAKGTGEEKEEAGTVSVKVETPKRQLLKRKVEQPGHIEALATTPIHAKIVGYVNEVLVDIDDRVQGPIYEEGKLKKEGDKLVVLSVPEMDRELDQKKALVAQAEAEIKQMIAAKEAAEAQVRTADALVKEAATARTRVVADFNRWNEQYTREQELVRTGVIDSQVLAESRNQREAARAAQAEVEAKVKSAESALAESNSHVAKAKADVTVAEERKKVAVAEQKRLEALMEYATLRAPFDGVVSRRQVEVGHLVGPKGDGQRGPLLVIDQMDTMRIFVDVPETDAVWVKKDNEVVVTVPALKGRQFSGKVTRSSWVLDQQTRTLRTAIDLSNKGHFMRPGMYAYAAITVEHPEVMTVPASAVQTRGDESHCYLFQEGKAIRTKIQIGHRNDDLVEVLKKWVPPEDAKKKGAWADFTGKEAVIADNLSSLKDGQPLSRKKDG